MRSGPRSKARLPERRASISRSFEAAWSAVLAIDWSKLESLLKAGGGLAGLGVLANGHESSLTLGLILGGATLFVTVVVPPSKALGRGLERWIDKVMDSPQPPPAQSE